jgi:DNA-binding transcriptional regulator of glucitol operon
VPSTRSRRFALILLVIVAAAGCLALGWWQWTRYESTSGTFQNLGYALQWPFFAGFCIYAYRKFVRYEQSPPPPPGTDGELREIPAGLLPERPTAPQHSPDDPVLREYNAYLAELADADQILVLDAGRIIERGCHDELLGRGGRYAQLWSMQAREETDPPQGEALPA